LVLADRILVLSRKPTTVVRDMMITEPRPRDMDSSPVLQGYRADLLDLFRRIGSDVAELEEAHS
jgi:ABC-type nitrate/sulfonate/bicarbonate transport system ATPase subunit